MIYKKQSFVLCTSILLLAIAGFSCAQKDKNRGRYSDSDMYDFSSPKVISLPTDLDEISGIAYYPKDTSVFAIVDENGLLYKIFLKNPAKPQVWKFGKGRDYEDIVLVDSTFYILVSNGDVEKVTFNGEKTETVKFDFITNKKNKNEFETLFLNPDKTLTLFCKDCEEDDKTQLSNYNFNPKKGDSAYIENEFFDMNPFVQKLGFKKHLKPSAAAINPVTGDLYMVSSILSHILIFDRHGEFKEMFRLNPGIYKQPEGMTFTPEGHLIISNEFADDGLPNLLIMKNKKITK